VGGEGEFSLDCLMTILPVVHKVIGGPLLIMMHPARGYLVFTIALTKSMAVHICLLTFIDI